MYKYDSQHERAWTNDKFHEINSDSYQAPTHFSKRRRRNYKNKQNQQTTSSESEANSTANPSSPQSTSRRNQRRSYVPKVKSEISSSDSQLLDPVPTTPVNNDKTENKSIDEHTGANTEVSQSRNHKKKRNRGRGKNGNNNNEEERKIVQPRRSSGRGRGDFVSNRSNYNNHNSNVNNLSAPDVPSNKKQFVIKVKINNSLTESTNPQTDANGTTDHSSSSQTEEAVRYEKANGTPNFSQLNPVNDQQNVDKPSTSLPSPPEANQSPANSYKYKQYSYGNKTNSQYHDSVYESHDDKVQKIRRYSQQSAPNGKSSPQPSVGFNATDDKSKPRIIRYSESRSDTPPPFVPSYSASMWINLSIICDYSSI